MREEGLRAWLPLDCFHLFQGVLVNYKIVGRDSYVNKFDTKPPVASL